MKKTLIGILAGAALTVATTAQAAAFLSIDVSGTTVTCNTSLAVNAGNCGAGFLPIIANDNNIVFGGTVNGVALGNVVGVVLGSQDAPAARAGVVEFTTQNNSGASRTITISFAENNFTSPAGTPVFFNASQTLNNISGPAVTGNFTGWGNGANTLLAGPGNGTPSITPACVTVASPPTNPCSTAGPTTSFARAGNFALNGVQSFTLANGGSVLGTASVVTQAVPEPASMILLGTGLVGLARTARRRQRSR